MHTAPILHERFTHLLKSTCNSLQLKLKHGFGQMDCSKQRNVSPLWLKSIQIVQTKMPAHMAEQILFSYMSLDENATGIIQIASLFKNL